MTDLESIKAMLNDMWFVDKYKAIDGRVSIEYEDAIIEAAERMASRIAELEAELARRTERADGRRECCAECKHLRYRGEGGEECSQSHFSLLSIDIEGNPCGCFINKDMRCDEFEWREK